MSVKPKSTAQGTGSSPVGSTSEAGCGIQQRRKNVCREHEITLEVKMVGFIIALIIVCALSATAFRGTNPVAFTIDIILLIVLTAVFNGGC